MKKIKQNDISQNLYELLKKHNIPMKNVNEMFRTLGEAMSKPIESALNIELDEYLGYNKNQHNDS